MLNYYINNENFDIMFDEIEKLSSNERAYRPYFFNNLNDNQLEKLKKINTFLVETDITPFFIKNKKANIIHYLEEGNSIYRREKLSNYLSNKYSFQKINKKNIFENTYNNDFDIDCFLKNDKVTLIISIGNDKDYIIDILPRIKSKIIYNVYDLPIIEELDKRADLVICSSKVQFKNIKNKNKIYIPNGCTVKEYKPVDKYKIKTAVYCGCNINKIDFNLLNLLKALNEDWNIEVIGIPEDKLEQIKEENPDLIIKGWMNEEDLHKELSSCHLGLCLLEVNDVTKGQLSDKFFNYANAHIPMLVNEELMENYEDYKDFVSSLDFDKLELDNYLKNIPDEKYNELLKECDWDNRFDQMMNIVKEQGLLSE